MAGLRDEVELDVASALRDIDRLGAALTQQTQKFRVDLARSLDTLRVTPKVDASGVERARKSTQGLATDVTKVTKATEGATAATGKYGRVLQGVAQIRVVQGLAAFFGGRALISQIGQTSQAYADFVQEAARSEQVFAEADSAVAQFASTAVDKVGLARREATKAANDFGTMFRDAGLSAGAAANLSTEFVKLGSDLSAFANIGVPEALLKLSAGLAGEIEPLRRIGFAIGQTAAETKALELGMVKVNGAFTQGQLTQARAAVILDKLRIVSGQYAREQDGLIGQQARARAELEQLREEVGEQLQPIMLELTRVFRDQIPTLGVLATNLIPAFVAAIQTGVPIVTSLLSAFAAFSPILSAVGAVLQAIPGPVLSLVAAFALLNSGIGPLPNTIRTFFTALKEGIATNPRGAIFGLGDAFASLNPWVLGATVAVTGFTAILSAHRAEQEKTERQVKETAAAFLDQAEAIRKDALATTTKRLTDENQIDDLRALGISVTEFTRLAASGQAGIDQLVAKMVELGGSQGLTLLSSQYDSVADAVAAYGNVAAAVAAGVVDGNEGLVESLFRVNQELQKSAKFALDQAVVTERLSAAQADAAIDDATVNGVTDWYAALLAVEPALAAAIVGAQGLAGAGEETTSAMEALDDALGDIRDALEETFGRFLDAEEATLRLQDAARDLAAALGEGRREGESLVDFQNRLRTATIDVARAVEDRALAMARAGEIEATQQGIQAEMVAQFQTLAGLFPELRGEIQGYIDKLGGIPAKVTTRVVTVYEEQHGSADAAREAAARDRAGVAANAGTAIADGIDANLDAVAEAGRRAGRTAAEEAADEIETTLRRSGRSGLNLGGFIVEGISLGARQAEVDLRNFINGMTMGLTGVVNDAMKIDAGEASDILQAVERMDRATRDLAEAREELGADSIEAKLAEMELADAVEAVNDAVVAATDSTEAYNDALEKVTDSIDTMTGSLRGLQSFREAQRAANDATKEVADQEARLAMFDRLIAETKEKLREARAAGDTQRAGRLEDAITDLENRRGDQARTVSDAIAEQQDAQLGLVDATQQLVDLGADVGAAQGVYEGFFRSLATQAGLSQAAIDALVASMETAGAFAGTLRNSVLTGSPQQVNLPTLAGANVGVAAVTGAGSTVKTYNFNIYETTSPRGTAVEVVDEIRAVELVG